MKKNEMFIESKTGRITSTICMVLSVLFFAAAVVTVVANRTPVSPQNETPEAAQSEKASDTVSSADHIDERDVEKKQNPIDLFFENHYLSEETSSNRDLTALAFAEADMWRAEFENAISILKNSKNKYYNDEGYLDAAFEKMRSGLELYTEYGSDIATLPLASNIFVDPDNYEYEEDEEVFEGTGAGRSEASITADIYRREALRLYEGILAVYENKTLDELFVFDPDELIKRLEKEEIILVNERWEENE